MRVSVVVPTFCRPDLLARCLDALGRQDFPATDWEILIVDDAASDTTRAQVEAAARAFAPVPIRYLAITATQGPAAARNAGWRAGSGAIIAFTDDDCVPDPDWLRAGATALDRTGADALGGRIIVPLPTDPTDYERDVAGLERAEFATANAWCRRDAMVAVGGFDERFTLAWREDSDLQFALITAGRIIAPAPEVVVVHPVRPGRWGISLSQQRKSRFEALLYRNFPRLYRAKISAGPPWSYYAAVVAWGVALVGWPFSWPIAASALGVWLILTARFCAKRLRDTSKRPSHVAEMLVTSALIPPLSVFWRLRGAVAYQVWLF